MEFNREANWNWLKGNGAVSNETLAALQEFDLVNADKTPLDRAKLKKQKGLPLNAAEFDALESDAKQREGNKETGGAALNGLGILNRGKKEETIEIDEDGELVAWDPVKVPKELEAYFPQTMMDVDFTPGKLNGAILLQSKLGEKSLLDLELEKISLPIKNSETGETDYDSAMQQIHRLSESIEFPTKELRDKYVAKVALKVASLLAGANVTYGQNTNKEPWLDGNGRVTINAGRIDCVGFASLVAYASGASVSKLWDPDNLSNADKELRNSTKNEHHMRNGKYFGGVQNARYMSTAFDKVEMPKVGSFGMTKLDEEGGLISDHIYVVTGVNKDGSIDILESAGKRINGVKKDPRSVKYNPKDHYWDTNTTFWSLK